MSVEGSESLTEAGPPCNLHVEGVCEGEGAKDEYVPAGMGLWGISFPASAQHIDLCDAELL